MTDILSYEASPIKRNRSTKAEVGRRGAALCAIAEESARQQCGRSSSGHRSPVV